MERSFGRKVDPSNTGKTGVSAPLSDVARDDRFFPERSRPSVSRIRPRTSPPATAPLGWRACDRSDVSVMRLLDGAATTLSNCVRSTASVLPAKTNSSSRPRCLSSSSSGFGTVVSSRRAISRRGMASRSLKMASRCSRREVLSAARRSSSAVSAGSTHSGSRPSSNACCHRSRRASTVALPIIPRPRAQRSFSPRMA